MAFDSKFQWPFPSPLSYVQHFLYISMNGGSILTFMIKMHIILSDVTDVNSHWRPGVLNHVVSRRQSVTIKSRKIGKWPRINIQDALIGCNEERIPSVNEYVNRYNSLLTRRLLICATFIKVLSDQHTELAVGWMKSFIKS